MLVATDIAARGIDVEALGHVINFDVPAQAEDYIHRVGRTGRAELTGEAFTFVSPQEMDDLRAIERAVGKPLLRVTLPDFDYSAKPAAKLEVPLQERIAEIRARKAEERARSKAKQERRAAAQPKPDSPVPQGSAKPQSRTAQSPHPRRSHAEADAPRSSTGRRPRGGPWRGPSK